MLQCALTFASGSKGSPPPEETNQNTGSNAQNDAVILNQRVIPAVEVSRLNPIPEAIPVLDLPPKVTISCNRKATTTQLDGHRYRICPGTMKRKVNCFCAQCIADGGGKNICQHHKQKHKCKQCKGKSLCIHGDQRSRCKKCHQQRQGGSGLCKHLNERWRGLCKKCPH